MLKPSITLHTLQYSKADLDAAPDDDRYFFLMATGLANELQMLLKLLAVIITSEPDDAHRIVNQGNSAYAMMIVRLLAGRLTEGWKILKAFSKRLKSDYEPAFADEGRAALRALRAYFNPKGGLALLNKVRDQVAFHSLRGTLEAAYAALPASDDLGDYLHRRMGNTLYYTTEILHYQSLKHLAGAASDEEALAKVQRDVQEQTTNFNTSIYAFVLVFAQRHLSRALAALPTEKDTIEVRPFDDLCLTFFSELPQLGD